MSLSDLWGKKLHEAPKESLKEAVIGVKIKTWKVRLKSLPKTAAEMMSLPEAALDTPYKTAALTVAALCLWTEDREQAKEMLRFLSGPKELSEVDWQFINDRLMDGKGYIPYSYFDGARPENDYRPSTPYTIVISEDPNSVSGSNYASVMLLSAGADSKRRVRLRLKHSTGQWFLWDQSLLAGIREPESRNAWA